MPNLESLLAEYRNEVYVAASGFFAWKNLNNLAASERAIYLQLQDNALTWQLIAHSLQITFFTALGRIFDRDRESRSLTVRSFIAACSEDIPAFSKSALEARRLKAVNGTRPDWLDDYLKDVYEPTAADFRPLADEAEKRARIYAANYEPIRHKMIAHKDLAVLGSRDSFYAKTNIGEVEGVLEFLYQAQRVVEELYNNGRRTELTDHSLPLERYIREDLEKLLRRLVHA